MADTRMHQPMTPPPRRARAPVDDTSFTRNMRYEFADAEGRAIMYSWILSCALGILWLLLVAFGPLVPPSIALLPQDTQPIDVKVEDLSPPAPTPQPAAAPSAPAPTPRPAAGGGRSAPKKNDAAAFGSAFGGAATKQGGGMVGDVSNVLRGVDVNSGAGSTPGQSGKAVIGYGQGGQGSRTPGRGGLGEGLGTTPGGGGLGGVGGGGGVGFSSVSVAPPSVIRAEKVGGPGRNVSDLGNYVRGRQSQLQFCYTENGLKVNPSLAGTVNVAVTLTGAGNVTGVDITNRTWSGAGASETEACIKQKILGWRFPSSEQGGGTYSFSFVFSK